VPSQVNRTEGATIAALVVPVIAAFVGLGAPRQAPLTGDLPVPRIPAAAVARAEREDLARIAAMRDSPALRRVDARFGEWNAADGGPRSGGQPVEDPARALAALQSAWRTLDRRARAGFLADRAARFCAVVERLARAQAEGREDREGLLQLRRLAGHDFEERAQRTGLVEAGPLVLSAAFKMRLVLSVAPADAALIPRVARIALHGFIAARAHDQSIARRLQSVEELGRLDRSYPVHLAAASLLALAGRYDEAADRLAQDPRPTVRIRNHLLWLAARQGVGHR